MTATEGGTLIDNREEQPENARLSKREILESDSNVTLESFKQPVKQFAERISTDDEMQIDKSGEKPEKTWLSRRERLPPDSNVTVERAGQLWKQPTAICSMSFGIWTFVAFGTQSATDL
jgi:hypothetical protein